MKDLWGNLSCFMDPLQLKPSLKMNMKGSWNLELSAMGDNNYSTGNREIKILGDNGLQDVIMRVRFSLCREERV